MDPVTNKLLQGTPYAGMGGTQERNALIGVIRNLISEDKYTVDYILNYAQSVGYQRQMAEEVFKELTGLSPKLIVNNNEYYNMPSYVPNMCIAWGTSKSNKEKAFYIVPFEYGYAVMEKDEVNAPIPTVISATIPEAFDELKKVAKGIQTLDKIITKKLLESEDVQTDAHTVHQVNLPYASSPLQILKKNFKDKVLSVAEFERQASKLLEADEITVDEAEDLMTWKQDLIDEDESYANDVLENNEKWNEIQATVEFQDVYNEVKSMAKDDNDFLGFDNKAKALFDSNKSLFRNVDLPEAADRLYQLLLGFSKEEILGHSKFEKKQSTKIDDSNFKYTYITKKEWDETPDDYKTIIEGIKYMMFPVDHPENGGKLCPIKIKQDTKITSEKTYKIKVKDEHAPECPEEAGKILEWTMPQILEEINKDHSDQWTNYDENDWKEGLVEWTWYEPVEKTATKKNRSGYSNNPDYFGDWFGDGQIDYSKIINPEDEGKVWMVKLWGGSGYQLDVYLVKATSIEDAINKVFEWSYNNEGKNKLVFDYDYIQDDIQNSFDEELDNEDSVNEFIEEYYICNEDYTLFARRENFFVDELPEQYLGKKQSGIAPTEKVTLEDGRTFTVRYNPNEKSITTVLDENGKEVGVDAGTRLQLLRKLFHKGEPTIVNKTASKKKASKKVTAENMTLDDIEEEDNKDQVQEEIEKIDETPAEDIFSETTPEQYFDKALQEDKVDTINDVVSKCIDKFSEKFKDFDKYQVKILSYNTKVLEDDKPVQEEMVEDKELNANAILQVILQITNNAEEENIKKVLAVFSITNGELHWTGTVRGENDQVVAFTEEGFDALFEVNEPSEEELEDII